MAATGYIVEDISNSLRAAQFSSNSSVAHNFFATSFWLIVVLDLRRMISFFFFLFFS